LQCQQQAACKSPKPKRAQGPRNPPKKIRKTQKKRPRKNGQGDAIEPTTKFPAGQLALSVGRAYNEQDMLASK